MIKIPSLHILLTICLLLISTNVLAGCATQQVVVQVLGSGGPEMNDKRASSAYLVWMDDQARVLVDFGGGASLRFEQSGASINDLDAVLFSHFHVDHSADFPALVKASFFSGRERDLPVMGPSGNRLLPGPVGFLSALFGRPDSAYPYLSEYLSTSDNADYHLKPVTIDKAGGISRRIVLRPGVSVQAVPVYHGPLPALAWRVDVGNCSVVFSGDMNNTRHTLAKLAKGADILIAHNAIPEGSTGVARNLHMPPSEIGRIAAKAGVKKLVLSHRMLRTLGQEAETLKNIQQFYAGPVEFADDLDRFEIQR